MCDGEMKLLKNFLKTELDIDLSCETEEKFRVYLNELKIWNKKINLTAIEKDTDIEIKHFIDSLAGVKAGIKDKDSVLDIGSGAGFPGIPIKIVIPGIKLTVVESIEKKTKFIRNIVEKLRLSDLEVLHSRSELLPETLRERFDYVLCRAVAPINVSIELALPWIKVGGFGVFYVKGSCDLKGVKRVLQILGGEFYKEIPYKLPIFDDRRKILVIKKVTSTDMRFPRRVGVAAKKPL